MYGDFITPGYGGGRTLGGYSRSLNGVVGTYEDARVRFAGWSSRERSTRQVDELRGRGVSGPYQVTIAPFVDGTERVEVVVRDRSQSAVVLSVEARQRFVDYTIDALSGEILLKAPLPSVDGDLNPVYLRVTYEVEGGGEAYWTTGFEGRLRKGRMEFGGTYVDDHDPIAAGSIRSAFVAAKTGPRSTLEAEFASTRENATGQSDIGGRVEWRHAAAGVEARAYAGATGEDFFNPTSGYAAGRLEGGGRVTAVLTPRTRLSGEALFTGDTMGGERRGGVLVAVERKLNERLRGELGLRLADGRTADHVDEDFAALVRARLLARVPAARNLDAYLEYEQDTQDAERRLAALGAEMQLLSRRWSASTPTSRPRRACSASTASTARSADATPRRWSGCATRGASPAGRASPVRSSACSPSAPCRSRRLRRAPRSRSRWASITRPARGGRARAAPSSAPARPATPC
jgi:hypothetical protein